MRRTIGIVIEKEYSDVAKGNLCTADIYVDDSWVKEVGGLSTVKELLVALSKNEDFLEMIEESKE